MVIGVAVWLAAIFATNQFYAWSNKASWDNYHENPEDATASDDYVYAEIFPGLARDYGPILSNDE